MDFGNATLLTVVVFALVEGVKRTLTIPSRWVPTVAALCAQATVWLVGATVWAHEQVIGGHNLAGLDVWSKVFVGFMLTGTAIGLNEGLGAIGNIGENRP